MELRSRLLETVAYYSRSLLISLCGMHGSEAVTAVSFEVIAL